MNKKESQNAGTITIDRIFWQKMNYNNVTAPQRSLRKKERNTLAFSRRKRGGSETGISYMDEKRVCRLR